MCRFPSTAPPRFLSVARILPSGGGGSSPSPKGARRKQIVRTIPALPARARRQFVPLHVQNSAWPALEIEKLIFIVATRGRLDALPAARSRTLQCSGITSTCPRGHLCMKAPGREHGLCFHAPKPHRLSSTFTVSAASKSLLWHSSVARGTSLRIANLR